METLGVPRFSCYKVLEDKAASEGENSKGRLHERNVTFLVLQGLRLGRKREDGLSLMRAVWRLLSGGENG